ncbi:MFS transporter [Streptomyces sp. NBC_01239]|uniref:MFS transporter n=1 Tax=Streptomyces sp. NBC_01239 TaxID=2903792 RepID=UPI00225C29A4|nr:MFS transporter [Streptomyces sp. NBC_01239]MCX4815209.1 MFS transporter [Streptomyces sp. NBC_01239]
MSHRTPKASPPHTSGGAGPSARKVGAASLLGTFIEFYDFTCYGFLIVYMAPLFFPTGDPSTGVLTSLGVYGVGYLARPLGALFFGRLGDRRGRRFALLVTVTGMGTATTVMGVLPTFGTVGIAAPILLVVVRMVQGFCAGGEIGGAATLMSESDGGRRRGRFQALIPLGSSLGVAVAPAVVGLLVTVLGKREMADWGWRVPLLLSAAMTLAVVLYRARVDDSPEFRSLAEAAAVERSPVTAALRDHWRMITVSAVLNLVVTMVLGVLVNYMSVYLLSVLGLPPLKVYWLSAVCLLLGASGFLVGGWWTDRFGRRSAMLLGYGGSAVLIFPLLYGMRGIASGGPWALVGAGALYVLALAFSYAAAPAMYVTLTQAFPVEVRYTSAAFAYNAGAVAGGGLTPYLAAQLTESAGPTAAGWLVVAAATTGVTVMSVLTSEGRRQRNSDQAIDATGPFNRITDTDNSTY